MHDYYSVIKVVEIAFCADAAADAEDVRGRVLRIERNEVAEPRQRKRAPDSRSSIWNVVSAGRPSEVKSIVTQPRLHIVRVDVRHHQH